MFYLKSDQQNADSLDLIREVLEAHVLMHKQKQEELVDLMVDELASELHYSALQKEIEDILIQISAIQYTLEYVTCMLNIKDKLK